MANEEEQLRITAVELRKFRKKLRQIERLEELERDLTEDEIFKVKIQSISRQLLHMNQTLTKA